MQADPAKFLLTHARHDVVHCNFPGMFRSIDRSSGNRERVELTYRVSDKLTIEAVLTYALCADDLRVLLGLIAFAAIQDSTGAIVLGKAPQSPEGRELRDLLETNKAAESLNACIVRCPYSELAREIGYRGTRNTGMIKAVIKRLSMVTFFVHEGHTRMSYRLLSHTLVDRKGVAVALNPRLAAAIMGGHHVRIPMDEIRNLHSPAALLMHQRICAWLNPGFSSPVYLATLVSYVFPDPTEGSTHRKRLYIVRVGLAELGNLPGWKVHIADKCVIKRPKQLKADG